MQTTMGQLVHAYPQLIQARTDPPCNMIYYRTKP